jgi:hypothetical protein
MKERLEKIKAEKKKLTKTSSKRKRDNKKSNNYLTVPLLREQILNLSSNEEKEEKIVYSAIKNPKFVSRIIKRKETNQKQREIDRGNEINKLKEEKVKLEENNPENDRLKEKQKAYQEGLAQQPFEDVISALHNASQWTAAFTIVKINNKPIRTLADTGASHSIISLKWLQQLGLEKGIVGRSDLSMVDAQKKSFPVTGTITIPVEFGGKDFNWNVRVTPNLICPFIIGMDLLNTGCVSGIGRYVEIQRIRQPITITLGEISQPTVIAATNLVVPRTIW